MTDRPVHHETAYDKAHESTPNELKKRRERAKARYWMIKKFGELALKGKEVDHIKSLKAGGTNDPSNWRIRDASENRGDKTY